MILVTGGAGFIGSNLVDELVSDGYSVKVLDNLSTGKLANLHKTKDKIEFIKSDIRTFSHEILKDVELIFHEAAQVDVRKSVDDPKYDLDVNVNGTINLLEGAVKHGIEKIIYASSAAVYGEPGYLPVDEKHPTNPISPYGASKLMAEKYLRVYSEINGINYTALRYSNVYGRRQDPLGEAGVISIFLNRILNNKKPIIFGDGTQTRDYVCVRDIVQSNLLAMDKKIKNKILNVGTDTETSINELVEIISEILGKEIEPIYTDARKGDIQRMYFDSSKINEIGFKPGVNLKEGMSDVIDWMKKEQI